MAPLHRSAMKRWMRNAKHWRYSLLHLNEVEYQSPIIFLNPVRRRRILFLCRTRCLFSFSELFVKLKRNKLVEVTPHEIHFDGFELNQTHIRELHVINRSSDVLRVDILPPQTSAFQIEYKKPQRLVPGFSIRIKIHFKPTQWQYYHDAIRIHTPERDHHLIVPIHAYPIILLDGILPNSYQFANTSIGQVYVGAWEEADYERYRWTWFVLSSVTKTFAFQSAAPVEFQYRIDVLSQDPAITIRPMEGSNDRQNVVQS